VGWRSPIAGSVQIQGKVTAAHPECGNGTTWSLALRRGHTRQLLAQGIAAGATVGTIELPGPIAIRQGDLVSLAIGPRDGNHACDLTDIELTLTDTADAKRVWNLSRDISSS